MANYRPSFFLLIFSLATWASIALSFNQTGRSLLAPGDAFDPPNTGEFVILGVGPVAATHTTQIPDSNLILLVDFLNFDPHPPGFTNDDGSKILWLWNAETNTYTNVPVPSNIVCGGWTKLADGSVAMFGGHAPIGALRNGVQDLYVYNVQTGQLEDKGRMLQPRWYATAITLADGKAYVFGGTTVVGAFTKSPGAEIFDPLTNQKQLLPVNAELMAAGVGNFYVGAWVLPTGKMVVFNSNMVQVIDIYTGTAVARGPPIPKEMVNIRWEYPYQGNQVLLTIPAPRPKAPSNTWEFMIFGGAPGNGNTEFTQCSQYSARISLEIKNHDAYEFHPWVIEQMPAPRCLSDAVLLPNNKVLIISGSETGLGGLPDAPEYNCGNCANEPVTEPWEYIPEAPVGKRFKQTGAYSLIPRLYHNTALLTAQGEVFIGGCSNCGRSLKSWKHPITLYSRTTFGNSEYRNELYKPSYVFSPQRPSILAAKKYLQYGGTLTVSTMLAAGSGPITKVVIQDAGTTTHSHTMNRRQLELRFTAAGNLLTVQGPPNGNWAPPGWYMLFVLVGDVYSTARWVQVGNQPGGQAEAAGPAAPIEEGIAGGAWTCLPYAASWMGAFTHIAVRPAPITGDGQCFSNDGMGCAAFVGATACQTAVAGKQTHEVLTCGQDHQEKYPPYTGYEDPAHWCNMVPGAGPGMGPHPGMDMGGGSMDGWKCLHYVADYLPAGQGYHALKVDGAGDLMCTAFPVMPGKLGCIAYTTEATCENLVSAADKDDFVTLSCGKQHVGMWTVSGYAADSPPGHWCQTPLAELAE